MKAYVFPGQGAQFEGMGKNLYEESTQAKSLFEEANDVLGFRLSDTMFGGSKEELRQTNITQPAIFVHSIVTASTAATEFQPDGVAGHSLGEFSALVAAGTLSFSDALKLVHRRAEAMQKACVLKPGTMAAVLGMDDAEVANICAEVTDGVVIPANYNSPGQLVISGDITAVEKAAALLKEAGARKVVMLPVGGAFHSPLMQPAQDELQAAIEETVFSTPRCPIYQNVDAQPNTDPEKIKENLIKQLTAPVQWTKSVQQMIADDFDTFVEVGGNGKVLQGLIRKIDRSVTTDRI